MANQVKKLVTTINTVFYNHELSKSILINNTEFKREGLDDSRKSEDINSICKKISDKSINSATLKDEGRYYHIALNNYFDFKRIEDDKLIFKIENINGDYSIVTGIYCGVINFNDNLSQIEIRTGYSDYFFKRILNFCCGIYADNNVNNNTEENESIYSLLIQYLFLISLRKVSNIGFPKKYINIKERGYNVRGNIDINEYVNNDFLSFDKKVTYQYSERQEIQPIIDVLYSAVKACKINQTMDILPEVLNFENYLKEKYSGTRPSRLLINNILKSKCLKNGLFSSFKRPLEYAKILLDNNDLNSGDNKATEGINGFLVDASFLWEMYLYNLMKLNLEEWEIDSQSSFSFYENTFFTKNNYPDFVLKNKNNGDVYILDAKFKKMTFKGEDIDNEDLHQISSYSYHFNLKYGDRFRGAALIYPTKIHEPKDITCFDSMFGIKRAKQKFGIFAIKDPYNYEKKEYTETISNSEKIFINKLKDFISN